jgi:hypothetical protein
MVQVIILQQPITTTALTGTAITITGREAVLPVQDQL